MNVLIHDGEEITKKGALILHHRWYERPWSASLTIHTVGFTRSLKFKRKPLACKTASHEQRVCAPHPQHTDTHIQAHTYTYTFMNTCSHTHMHTFTLILISIHTYTHSQVHTYIKTSTHTHAHTYIQTPSDSYRNTASYIHTHSYIHTYTQLYSHIHTYMHSYTYIHTGCLHVWGTAIVPGCETCDILKFSMALGTAYAQISPVAVWPHQRPQFSALYPWAQRHLGDQPASPNFASWKWETIKKQRAPLCPSSWTLHCFISGLESTPFMHSLIFLRYRKRSATTRQD